MGAFEVYRQYYRQVYFYVLGLCRNEHIAEEITQETFFKVLKQMDTFRGECKINVWITQIAKNTFFNYCRRKKLDPENSLEDVEENVEVKAQKSLEERIMDKEAAQEIHMVLHEMPEPYRDLLPLYCDQVCSQDSAEAVKEHIDTCENCRNIYMEMKQGASLEASMDSAEYERQQLASMQQVRKKIKKKNTIFGTVGLIIGILLVVTVIRLMLAVGVVVFAVNEGKKDTYTSTDINKYRTFEDFRGHSKLDVFPEQISGDMEVQDYFYYYADTFLDPTAQIYLECSYDQDSYLKEIQRLEGIQEEYKGKVQTVMYDTESFSYPAYVTINANDHCYEYALLLGDERIAYVFLQFIKEEEIVFPAEYLPEGYEETKDGYSVYIFYGENGNGYWGLSY